MSFQRVYHNIDISPTVTFVTALIDLREDRTKDKPIETCFSHFHKLVESGISLCVFASPIFKTELEDLCQNHNNIHLITTIELDDLNIYMNIKSNTLLTLPNNRTIHHDTYNFMALMNSKVEFVKMAIDLDPFKTTHFAWIDFSIYHVIKNIETLQRLHTFGHSSLNDKMMIFPACWDKHVSVERIKGVVDQIHWRFCGGFFIGDKMSMLDFYKYYQVHFPRFLEQTRKLVWEVNFWAWLEHETDWNPHSYLADHNDSMLRIPSEYITMVVSLTTIPPRIDRCKRTIHSLLSQVDHIYVSMSTHYERFGDFKIPNFSHDEEFNDKVTIVESEDYGPATKYLGSLSKIPKSQWMFICDDDQEYHPELIRTIKNDINLLGAYQNRYHIVKNGSGGIIHGYVGNMIHRSLLNRLPEFDLPLCSRHTDDQWMSIYYFINNISIYPTSIESYSMIFSVLMNGYEQIGEASLADLGTRDARVEELAKYFKIIFKPEGRIESI